MKDLLADEAPRSRSVPALPQGSSGGLRRDRSSQRCGPSGARTQKMIESKRDGSSMSASLLRFSRPFGVSTPVRVGSYDSSRLSARTGKMHRARDSRLRRVVAIKTPPTPRHRRVLECWMRSSLRGPSPRSRLRSCNLSAETAVLASEVGQPVSLIPGGSPSHCRL